jgi:calcium-dependent protein kinase
MRGICHRDLKPENIMFENKSSSKDPLIKVIDFGLAKYFKSDVASMNSRTGTPYYMAPEVLEGNYNESCDMWSLGVITYCLLCGYPPFNGDNDAQLYKKIKTCDYEFHDTFWSDISDEAKNFIV